MIEAGLVGAGHWGQTLVQSVQGKSSRITFRRAVTRTPSKVRQFATETGLLVDDDFDALLADPAVDAVVLATPHSQHLSQIIAAAAAGKHIFCEKPLTLNAASARAAFDAARAGGVTLALGHNRRCLPTYLRLRDVMKEGALGQILHVEGNFSGPSAFRQKPGNWRAESDESPAGGMTGKGIHITDLMISLLGPVSHVHTISRRQVLEYGMDDTTLVTLRFASGQTGSLSTLTATPADWRLQVYGTDGWVEIRDENLWRRRGRNGETTVEKFAAIDCERTMLEWFADTLETGRPWMVGEDEAISNTALLETIANAIREGGPHERRVETGEPS